MKLSEYTRTLPMLALLGFVITGISPEEFQAKCIEALGVIREGHSETPIVCISPTYTRRTKSTKSDYTFDEFREAVAGVVVAMKEKGDKNVYLCRGEEITSEDNLKVDAPRDMTHFSETGATMMAGAMVEWIQANVEGLGE